MRTPSQIQAAMGAELAGTETGLAAYWRFNASDAGGLCSEVRLHLTSEWNAGMVHWDV